MCELKSLDKALLQRRLRPSFYLSVPQAGAAHREGPVSGHLVRRDVAALRVLGAAGAKPFEQPLRLLLVGEMVQFQAEDGRMLSHHGQHTGATACRCSN